MIPDDNNTDSFPRFVDMDYWIVDDNTFIANLLAFGGDVNLTYTRMAPSVADGVWNGRVERDGSTIAYTRAELENGLFLSYALSSPNNFTQMTTTYGVLEVIPNTTVTTSEGVLSNATVTYSMWRGMLNNVSGGPPPGHLSLDASVLIPGNPSNFSAALTVTGAVTYFISAVSNDAIEGSYVGYNGNCSNVVNFRQGVYRSYVIGLNCNYGFLGAYTVLNDTHVRIGYGFSSMRDFEGQLLELGYSISSSGGSDTILTITIPGNNGTDLTLTFRKVLVPPKLRRARVFVNLRSSVKRDVAQNFDQASLIASAGSATRIGSSQVTVTKTRSGANLMGEVDLALSDDQALSGISSDVAFNTLKSLRQLDRYEVVCVEDLEDPSSSNCSAIMPASSLSSAATSAPAQSSAPINANPPAPRVATPMQDSSLRLVWDAMLFAVTIALALL
jgi:hypothetical protein